MNAHVLTKDTSQRQIRAMMK